MTSGRHEEPIEAESVPGEERIDKADLSEGVDQDSREQPNFTEAHPEEAERIRSEARDEH